MTDEQSERHFLAMCPNFWGKGKTRDAALRQLRLASGYDMARIKKRYSIWRCHPDTTVCEVTGTIYSPVGHPAERIEAAGVKA